MRWRYCTPYERSISIFHYVIMFSRIEVEDSGWCGALRTFLLNSGREFCTREQKRHSTVHFVFGALDTLTWFVFIFFSSNCPQIHARALINYLVMDQHI
ncbi:hypothetical protein AB205_0039700 [Aquarana catesbeiana]|uniref:Uncharacterized protein n=1 Tax=Aquarana catesbeiana TaxID=8400 RepID=A0A2G9QE51_AQUCT|nr:hypothetical protein AB205_0039700 [Aquarana catesbeiana]